MRGYPYDETDLGRLGIATEQTPLDVGTIA